MKAKPVHIPSLTSTPECASDTTCTFAVGACIPNFRSIDELMCKVRFLVSHMHFITSDIL